MHLLPAERSAHRVIDGEQICQAIAAPGPPEVIQARARVVRGRRASTPVTALLDGQ